MRGRREGKKWLQVSKDMRKAARRVEHISRALAMEAGVTAGISRTGHVTLRCSSCGKVCYTSREAAEAAVAMIPDPMTAYLSERCGGFWHLATQRDRRDAC